MLFIFRSQDLSSVRISSPYGSRVDPITGERGVFHRGLDIAGPPGTPILAPADGVVQFNRTNSGGASVGFGHYVVLRHKGRVWTLFAHLIERSKHVTEGQTVKAGEIIGLVGSTGRSTGPHVHYEIHEGTFKFVSQISGRGSSDDPTVNPFNHHPGLSDYVGKRSLKGYRPEASLSEVLWIGSVKSTTLNVRTVPTTRGNDPIRQLKRGDLVSVYKTTGSEEFEWLKIGPGEYVSNARGEYIEEVGGDGKEVEVTVEVLNVRRGPGTEFDRSRTLRRGSKVVVYAIMKSDPYEWAYIGGGEFIANTKEGAFFKRTAKDVLNEGDKVRVQEGSRDIKGTPLHRIVFNRNHDLVAVDHDRDIGLIEYNRIAIAWMNLSDLKKV